MSSTSFYLNSTMRKWNTTGGRVVLLKGIGSGRSSLDSLWRRFIDVTAVRKFYRGLIGAFLPDLFSVIYQFFPYLSNFPDNGQWEWFSCAHVSISMHFSSVHPIFSCESRKTESRWKRS